jgi:hypothetical protein
MSCMMTDVILDRIDHRKVNAACNCGRQLLKAVELQLKHGERKGKGGPLTLSNFV